MTELMQTNVILEAKTRIGKRRLEADGNEFVILGEFKRLRVAKSLLVTLESKLSGGRILINVEGDKDFNIRFQ